MTENHCVKSKIFLCFTFIARKIEQTRRPHARILEFGILDQMITNHPEIYS